MNPETLKANVQYGDYDGTIAADRHDQRSLSTLAEKYGIDTNKYFVIGADFFLGENPNNKVSDPSISILVVDKSIVTANSVDQINKYIEENNGILPFSEIWIDATLEEFILCFTRLNIVVKNKYIKNVVQYKQQYHRE